MSLFENGHGFERFQILNLHFERFQIFTGRSLELNEIVQTNEIAPDNGRQ